MKTTVGVIPAVLLVATSLSAQTATSASSVLPGRPAAARSVHDIKLYGTYVFPGGLTGSLRVQITSGKPLTALAANPNPNYQNGGEIPLTPRGAGMQTSDGFITRTPFTKTVNGQASYNLKLGGNRTLVLLGDVFNIFNTQTPIDYDSLGRIDVRRGESGLRQGWRIERHRGPAVHNAAADPPRRHGSSSSRYELQSAGRPFRAAHVLTNRRSQAERPAQLCPIRSSFH
jgi:hypothetical protein